MRALVIPWAVFILLFCVSSSAPAVDKDDDRVYPPYAQPSSPNIAVRGPEPREDDFYGPNKKRDDFYGPGDVNTALTDKEYKTPVCNGTISAIGDTYVTIIRSLGKSTFYHTFVINRRTKFTGEVKRGAAVSISYNVGAQKKANRNVTTMTAIEVKVIGKSGLEGEDKKVDSDERDKGASR